jgi:hypothetical protein
MDRRYGEILIEGTDPDGTPILIKRNLPGNGADVYRVKGLYNQTTAEANALATQIAKSLRWREEFWAKKREKSVRKA